MTEWRRRGARMDSAGLDDETEAGESWRELPLIDTILYGIRVVGELTRAAADRHHTIWYTCGDVRS